MPTGKRKQRRAPAEPEEEAPRQDSEDDERGWDHVPLYSAQEKAEVKLRFAIGAEVACNMGDEWPEGRVVKRFYRQASFPRGHYAAYQVKLHDGGELIVAPRDHDGFVGVPLAAKEATWDAYFLGRCCCGAYEGGGGRRTV